MSEAKWYVVHTYSGYENKVKANIEKTIENRHLEDQILEVRVPMEEVVELKNGVQKTAQRKLFPGYVMIHMVMNDDTWYVVRNTRGVTGFVGPGSKAVPLEEEEMANLGIKREEVVVNFGVGDTVTVLSGAWEGTVGVVQLSLIHISSGYTGTLRTSGRIYYPVKKRYPGRRNCRSLCNNRPADPGGLPSGGNCWSAFRHITGENCSCRNRNRGEETGAVRKSHAVPGHG